MIKGEYRGASLGWLVVVLVALGVWALVWGPSDDADDDEDIPADDGDPAPTTTAATPTSTEAALPVGGVDGPVLRHPPPLANDSDSAEIRGLLVLEGECLLVDSPWGERFPIVWPAGTTWDPDEGAVVLVSGERFAIGNAIRGWRRLHQRPGSGGSVARIGVSALAADCVEGEYRELAYLGNNPTFVEAG